MNTAETQRNETERPWAVESDGAVRLLASVEEGSGLYFFPPVPKSSPQAGRYKTVPLAVEAVLYSHTTIHPNPKTGKPPFVLAYADFPERVRVLGRLKCRSGERPQIGSRLHVELEANSDGSLDYVFSSEK